MGGGGGRGVGDGSGVAQRLVGTWEATAIWQGRKGKGSGATQRSNRSGGAEIGRLESSHSSKINGDHLAPVELTNASLFFTPF